MEMLHVKICVWRQDIPQFEASSNLIKHYQESEHRHIKGKKASESVR